MSSEPDFILAAQTPEVSRAFVEAFAKVTVHRIRRALGAPLVEAAKAEEGLSPDWDNVLALKESGLVPAQIDSQARAGKKYLHIDVAADKAGSEARLLFLSLTGLSDKQQSALFPILHSTPPYDRGGLSLELGRLNAWLDEVRADGLPPVSPGRGQTRFLASRITVSMPETAPHFYDLPTPWKHNVRSPRKVRAM